MVREADSGSREVYARLDGALPADRAEIVLELIEAHPRGRLTLPSQHGLHAMLDELDLSREALEARLSPGTPAPPWWDSVLDRANLVNADLRGASLRLAHLRGVNLSEANLQDALLGGADLSEAKLEGVNFRCADLAGARLEGAVLSGACLQRAMLEDARLMNAEMRFSDLQASVLEGADLQGADLWGSCLDDAVLVHAKLTDTKLQEAKLRHADLSGADLRSARLEKADLEGACLGGADLRGTSLRGASLQQAILRDAALHDLDLLSCNISGVHLSGAWLERTRLRQEQLGDAIGEELAGQYTAAGRGYLGLERNFAQLGDPDAASWAYRKRRQMQKLAALGEARAAWSERSLREAMGRYASYLTDLFVEWLCDYGESIPRVLRAMFVGYVFFALLYGLTDSVVRVEDGPDGMQKVATRDALDLAVFSLLAMTTSGSPVVGLFPRHEFVHFLTGIEALLGIFLTGLLGFIVGNRIRR